MIQATHARPQAWIPVLATAIAAALAGACMTPQRTQPLRDVVRSYNDGIRWQRFNLAAAHVPAAGRDDFLDRHDQLSDDLRISDYEVIRVRYDDARHQARVHIKFTWHLDSRGVVHTTHVPSRVTSIREGTYFSTSNWACKRHLTSPLPFS